MLQCLIILAQLEMCLPSQSKVVLQIGLICLLLAYYLLQFVLFGLSSQLFKFNGKREVIECFNKVTLSHQGKTSPVKHIRVIWSVEYCL
jgi:hypothetical protein